MGPALPMGDDFEGLAYLHGCLRQSPGELVVTDGDFGRAYLRDSWAARFLERMFATYTVLFVGYSHKDTVMSYLGRSLGPAQERFALTSEPDASHWKGLRILPVGYPMVGESHEALTLAVNGWASWASMGLLDHRQRISQLVATAPSQVPDEQSYLETVINDIDQFGFFAEFARGKEWLDWIAVIPTFQIIFDAFAIESELTRRIAYWFAEHFVMDECSRRMPWRWHRLRGSIQQHVVVRDRPPTA